MLCYQHIRRSRGIAIRNVWRHCCLLLVGHKHNPKNSLFPYIYRIICAHRQTGVPLNGSLHPAHGSSGARHVAPLATQGTGMSAQHGHGCLGRGDVCDIAPSPGKSNRSQHLARRCPLCNGAQFRASLGRALVLWTLASARRCFMIALSAHVWDVGGRGWRAPEPRGGYNHKRRAHL